MQKQPRVLVVDPSDGTRLAARAGLEAAGLEVAEAVNGASALESLASRAFDILILNQSLPDRAGFDLCAQLRNAELSQHLPVLMLIDEDDIDSIPGCYIAGATDFVSRPVNWLVLVQRVLFHLRSAQATKELRESQEDLAESQRLAKIGHWTYDFAADLIHFSTEAYRIFGIPEGTEIDEEVLLEQVHPQDRAVATHGIVRARDDHEGFSLDYRITPTGEAERVVHVHGEVKLDEHYEPTGIRGSIQDVTDRVRAEEQIRFLAYHDSLTGLGNRLKFKERLNAAIERARRKGSVVGLAFIDLDHFKRINDTLGHSAGDELLCAVAERLQKAVRGTDTIARDAGPETGGSVSRLGGDEFTILLDDVREPYDVTRVARRIRRLLPEPLTIEGHEVVVTASIGIACWPTDGDDFTALMRNADAALYEAKKSGRDNFKFYSHSMDPSVANRMTMEGRLRRALERGDFGLFYQPQVRVSDGRVTGVEALMRWTDAKLGDVPPSDFIQIAEQMGFIESIGDWALETACAAAAKWVEDGLGELTVAVNLSANQLTPMLPSKVASILEASGLDPGRLELEITESALIGNEEVVTHVLRDLKRLGVRLALDDFGIGFSSLSYLKRFPVDTVKVDKSFIQGLAFDSDDRAITEAILHMGRALGLKVVAEGVEELAQLDFLREHGCDELQGWLFSKAVCADQLGGVIAELATAAEKLPQP